MYRPLSILFPVGLTFVTIGLIPIIRFFSFFLEGRGEGHVQSLILGSMSLLLGMLVFMIGLLAELTAFNRQLLVAVLEKVRDIDSYQRQYGGPTDPVPKAQSQ
jgi:multisubunit Na+/H+ antiporter MnhG subunit